MKKKFALLLLAPLALLLAACGQASYSLDVYFETDSTVAVDSKFVATGETFDSIMDNAGRSDLEIMGFFAYLTELARGVDGDDGDIVASSSLSEDREYEGAWVASNFPVNEETEFERYLTITETDPKTYDIVFKFDEKLNSAKHFFSNDPDSLTVDDFRQAVDVQVKVYVPQQMEPAVVWDVEQIYDAYAAGQPLTATVVVGEAMTGGDTTGNSEVPVEDGDLISTVVDLFKKYDIYVYAGGGGLVLFLLVLVLLRGRKSKTDDGEKPVKVAKEKPVKTVKEKPVKVAKEKPVKVAKPVKGKVAEKEAVAEAPKAKPFAPPVISFTQAPDPDKKDD